MKLPRALRLLLVALPAAGLAGAACSVKDEGSQVASTRTPIIGGAVDTTDTWVVGIGINTAAGSSICSGSMIAPNLVLTARHCVSETSEKIDCRADAGLGDVKVFGDYPASAFTVSTNQDYTGGPAWSVRNVWYPNDATCTGGATDVACRLCGYDLALLELKPNSSGFPAKWITPSITPALKHGYDAIGYGCQDAPASAGAPCKVAGYRMSLNPVVVFQIDDRDLYVEGRVCSGDSGGPLFNRTANVIYGALSRGDVTTSAAEGCNYGIYTRLDVNFGFLQKYGAVAAKDGGYAAPAWVTEVAPPPDAGPPPPADAGPPPPKASLGEPCKVPSDCVSNVCVGAGEITLCSQACNATTKRCPAGYSCDTGYCWPDPATPPPDDAGAPADDAGLGTDDTGAIADDAASPPTNPDDAAVAAKSGCAMGPKDGPPPRPQPWILGLSAVGAIVLGRRRRR